MPSVRVNLKWRMVGCVCCVYCRRWGSGSTAVEVSHRSVTLGVEFHHCHFALKLIQTSLSVVCLALEFSTLVAQILCQCLEFGEVGHGCFALTLLEYTILRAGQPIVDTLPTVTLRSYLYTFPLTYLPNSLHYCLGP